MLRLSGAEQRLPRPAPMALPAAESIPPVWQAEGAVLCIAGRGPLDEVSAIMLAQILRKHGLGAQVVSYAEVSRRAVGHFEAPGARMACICAVQMRGAPTHLRYLLRRLRQRMPRLPLMVGLGATPDNALDDALHQSLGVPLVVGTLREAVIACARTAARAPE